jgi:putative transposase
LKVHVHPADASENAGGQALLERLGDALPRLAHLWTDTGYKKTFAEWVSTTLGWTVECVNRPRKPTGEYAQLLQDFLGEEAYQQRYPDGFVVLPRRWVVERTFAWFSHQRRLAKDYEYLPETSEAWHYLANARLTWKRLVKLKY